MSEKFTDAVALIRAVSQRAIELPPAKGSEEIVEMAKPEGAKKEIEIKVTVDNAEALIKFLEEHGTFISEGHQRDEYFSPTARDFLSVRPVKEWLRLREAGGKNLVNYKNWYYDSSGRASYCDEFEILIKDIEQVRAALSEFGFKAITIVDKLRRTYQYRDYEVALDSEDGLGNFVEVEYTGTDATPDPENIQSEMMAFLEKAGCKNIVRNYNGYPLMLLFPDEVEKAP